MKPEQTESYRVENADQYESQVAETAWHGHEIMFGLMFEYIKPNDSLLDIGIGTGLSSILFHKAGLQVSGFDNSAEMLEGCKSKGFTGKVVLHDLQNVPYPFSSNSIHHIVSLGVLNFYSDLVSVFQEVGRIIKIGGVFGIAVEDKKPGQERHYTIRVDSGTEGDKQPFHVSMYRHTDEYIRAQLKKTEIFVLKDHEFLADEYPEQDIKVYLKIYIGRKQSS
jgi:predicted TPR repeat methyltransferase